ncbi:hypothetical protein [Glutamicibacter sp.]|jgi:hypothetical protein
MKPDRADYIYHREAALNRLAPNLRAADLNGRDPYQIEGERGY